MEGPESAVHVPVLDADLVPDGRSVRQHCMLPRHLTEQSVVKVNGLSGGAGAVACWNWDAAGTTSHGLHHLGRSIRRPRPLLLTLPGPADRASEPVPTRERTILQHVLPTATLM